MREAEVSGRWSYSRARRRCSISVPFACSTTHRFGCGTKPLPWSAGLRRTTSTPKSSRAPWILLTDHTDIVTETRFSADGRLLATASTDHTVRLWNTADPARPIPLGRLEGFTDPVVSVALSPDGRTPATTVLSENRVVLWNVTDPDSPARSGPPVAAGFSSMVFSPDGKTLVTTTTGIADAPGDGTIQLWNTSDRARAIPLGQPLSGYTSPVKAVAFSPDGRTPVTAGSNLRLWNVTDPAHPAAIGQPLVVGTTETASLAFTPDGHSLATGGYDSTVRLWPLGADQTVRQICANTDTPTRAQWQQYLSVLHYPPPAADIADSTKHGAAQPGPQRAGPRPRPPGRTRRSSR